MKLLQLAQVILAVILMLSILLQNRGASLSGIFGGSDNVFRTKRGFERFLFIATIALAVAFFGLSILIVII